MRGKVFYSAGPETENNDQDIRDDLDFEVAPIDAVDQMDSLVNRLWGDSDEELLRQYVKSRK